MPTFVSLKQETEIHMPKGCYSIAGCKVRIHSLYEEVQQMCRNYAVAEDGKEDWMDVCTTEADIRYESLRSEKSRKEEGLPPYTFTDDYLETLAVYRKLATELLKRNILLFHGSTICVDGKAYLFTAKSGTGKSTHTRLWRQLLGDRAVMVNDDKPLMRITDEGVTVYGTPWDGKHHLSMNMEAPLQAICILERGQENQIEHITPAEAATMLVQQSFRPQEPALVIQSLALVDKLSKEVELYCLHCNMAPEAAKIAFEGMGGQL